MVLHLTPASGLVQERYISMIILSAPTFGKKIPYTTYQLFGRPRQIWRRQRYKDWPSHFSTDIVGMLPAHVPVSAANTGEIAKSNPKRPISFMMMRKSCSK